jgi:hypothetical protein
MTTQGDIKREIARQTVQLDTLYKGLDALSSEILRTSIRDLIALYKEFPLGLWANGPEGAPC